MSDRPYPVFTDAMKKDYVILAPNMLPIHFELIIRILKDYGYNMVLLKNDGRKIKDEGLKGIHNDACYPALIVTGQFIDALKSGKYDLKHTALIISQTGGGCRASNYLSLIRKAIAKEFPEVPVMSLNFSGLEKDNSLHLPLFGWVKLLYACLYGDFLMDLRDQSLPYEKEPGQAERILNEAEDYVSSLFKGSGFLKTKKAFKRIISMFGEIEIPKERKPKVAIVGEIFVKYSPLANNHLLEFLVKEGCEPVEPGLMEFIYYCIVNAINDRKHYGLNKHTVFLWKIARKAILRLTRKAHRTLTKTGVYDPPTDYEEIADNADRIINQGVKMGEGWLIPSEMVAFAEHGVPNIVCCQPFGCLPNHIVGKAMMRPVKKLCPDANIAAIDYDPSSTEVNQENRVKLMLSNIKR
jgi:predicted nucleotide-binding protein (sugar kinase/HSP70/actin superfamily)